MRAGDTMYPGTMGRDIFSVLCALKVVSKGIQKSPKSRSLMEAEGASRLCGSCGRNEGFHHDQGIEALC